MKPKPHNLANDPRLLAAVEQTFALSAPRIHARMTDPLVPSAEEVAQTTSELHIALLGSCASHPEASERLVRAAVRLESEVEKGLSWVEHDGRGGREGEAKEIVLGLIEALPTIRQLLREDAQASLDGDPAAQSLLEVVLAYPSLRALAVHRLAHFLYGRQVPLIPRIMSEYIHGQTGIDIHPGAKIGPGFFIDHGTGVVIGETAVIGRRCKLYQGVTLGSISIPSSGTGGWDPPQRHPTLGDHVTVYAQATILGGKTVVGEGSVIGGNVWLTRSVPPYTKVQMDPPNLLFRSAPDAAVKAPLDYQI